MWRVAGIYALSLAAMAAAIGLRWLLDPALGDVQPLTTVYAAVTFAALVGGWGPAVVASILGYLFASYLFIEPRGSISVAETQRFVGLLIYCLTIGIIIGLAQAMRMARQHARRTREQLDIALEASRVVAWTCDLRTRMVTISENAQSLLGLPRECTAEQCIKLIHPADVKSVIETVERAIQSRGSHLQDFRVIRPDNGQEVWIEDRGKVEFDAHGTPIRLVGTASDITSRKLAERSLARRAREQAALYEFTDRLQRSQTLNEIFDSALDSIVNALGCPRASILLFDFEGVMQFVASRGLSDVYRRAVAGHTPWKPDTRDPQPFGIEDILYSDSPDSLKASVTAEGIRSLGFIPMVENGRLIGKFMVYFDVPHAFTVEELDLALTIARQLAFAIERNRAEARLKENEERYRAVVESQAEMLCRFRPDGTIVFANSAYAQARGMTAEAMIGKDFWNFINVEDRPAVRAMLAQLTPENPEIRIENRFETKDGDRWTLWTNRGLAFNSHGVCIEAQSSGIDITDRKRAEEALRNADQRKDEFLATLAHELRNPLAPLVNSLELITRGRDHPQLTEAACDTMRRQLGHMVRLIDDLLDVSRISRNKLELKKQRIELSSVVQHAMEVVQPLFDEAKHELIRHLPPEPVYLHADPVRLAQVLGNLLNNACKYTPSGGRIELTAAQLDGQLHLSVKDNGTGIPPNMLATIFDLFTQMDRPLEHARGGLGIGLSLVKQLVEMHGGTVQAHSDGDGRGSEFVVRLPLVEAPAEQPDPTPSKPNVSVPRLRVLVVDDNKDAAECLARLLQLHQHDVVMAHDGVEAVEQAAAFDPHAIFLDIGLPRLDGYGACRAIRQQQRDTPPLVVAITGWGQDEDRRKTREAGFDAHLVKPVEFHMLAGLLSAIGPSQSPPPAAGNGHAVSSV